jgi:MYXO-CTERM domain-containing protein
MDNTVAPGKAELCDAQDNDCDSEIDEGCDESDDPPSTDPGCGCAATPGDSAVAPLLAVLAVAASRRRRAAR